MPDVKEFQELVKAGKLPAVEAALAADPSLLDATNEAGQSAFLLAKYYRQTAVAAYLLTLHPKLDFFARCAAGQTAKVLDEIDRQPEKMESHSGDGWTPLHLAAFFGHAELAKGLLNRGANLEARSTNAMQNTPLHAAAAGASVPLVSLLLEHGADANAQQKGGWTALHAAAQSGHLEMAGVLLQHGADRAARAENNQTPLDMALLHGRAEMALLLEPTSAREQ